MSTKTFNLSTEQLEFIRAEVTINSYSYVRFIGVYLVLCYNVDVIINNMNIIYPNKTGCIFISNKTFYSNIEYPILLNLLSILANKSYNINRCNDIITPLVTTWRWKSKYRSNICSTP